MTNKQIGGTHYQTAIQPIDYITANNMGFCEGNVVKYVTRHKGKDGRQDIEKAIQYLDFILKYQYDNVPVKVDYSDFYQDDDYGTGFLVVDSLVTLLSDHRADRVADDLERDLEFLLQKYSNLDEDDPFYIGK